MLWKLYWLATYDINTTVNTLLYPWFHSKYSMNIQCTIFTHILHAIFPENQLSKIGVYVLSREADSFSSQEQKQGKKKQVALCQNGCYFSLGQQWQSPSHSAWWGSSFKLKSWLRVSKLLHAVCSLLMRFVIWRQHFIIYRNLYTQLFTVKK